MDRVEKQPVLTVYQSEEIILNEGEYNNELYKILSGSVIVYIHYGKKDEHIVGILSKSRCFGDLSMFTGQPNLYTVVAYDEALIMRISWDYLEDFIRNNPKNAVDMMQNMSKSMTLMYKNLDLLMEEVYRDDSKKDTEKMNIAELKRKMVQYSMNGMPDWSNSFFNLQG